MLITNQSLNCVCYNQEFVMTEFVKTEFDCIKLTQLVSFFLKLNFPNICHAPNLILINWQKVKLLKIKILV
jgi:hypothetical protein